MASGGGTAKDPQETTLTELRRPGIPVDNRALTSLGIPDDDDPPARGPQESLTSWDPGRRLLHLVFSAGEGLPVVTWVPANEAQLPHFIRGDVLAPASARFVEMAAPAESVGETPIEEAPRRTVVHGSG